MVSAETLVVIFAPSATVVSRIKIVTKLMRIVARGTLLEDLLAAYDVEAVSVAALRLVVKVNAAAL